MNSKILLLIFLLIIGAAVVAEVHGINLSVNVSGPAPACSDDVDNDGDGKIDYPDDPGCSSASDDDETDPPAQQQQGGGGGGGWYVAPVTQAAFSGRAYPKSAVTLLKDAQIVATTIADANANFSVNITGISGGNYIFSVYSEDNKGIRSSLLNFPISVTTGATTNVGGIFIAPTISVDKSEVKRGDNIAIFGQSVSDGEITIVVSSEEDIFRKVSADRNGVYLYNFDTAILDMGQHFAKSKAALDGAISSFSKAIGFAVGTRNIAAELPRVATKGDLNNDRRVNLVDFSIAAYWYKRANPSAAVDLNGDGKVNLIDFSIMAFYWTG
jgi:hypothetical protein